MTGQQSWALIYLHFSAMKTSKPLEVNYCLLTAKPLSFLQYQSVYQYINEKKYLRAINILKDGIQVQKYRLEVLIPFDEALNESSIVARLLLGDYVEERLSSKKENKKRSTGSKPKVSKDARTKAANNLFTSLGL